MDLLNSFLKQLKVEDLSSNTGHKRCRRRSTMTSPIGKVADMKVNQRRKTCWHTHRYTIQNLDHERSEVCLVPFAGIK